MNISKPIDTAYPNINNMKHCAIMDGLNYIRLKHVCIGIRKISFRIKLPIGNFTFPFEMTN
jgi:hypothetical protein